MFPWAAGGIQRGRVNCGGGAQLPPWRDNEPRIVLVRTASVRWSVWHLFRNSGEARAATGGSALFRDSEFAFWLRLCRFWESSPGYVTPIDNQDDQGFTDQLTKAAAGDQRALTDLLSVHRLRLRKLVSLRLDHRLRGRVDPSDVIQEAFLEANSRLTSYQQNPTMPFFIWLRFITVQKLLVFHRRHLGTKMRDASRDVSIFRREDSEASSAELAERLIGCQTSPSQAVQRAERRLRIEQALEAMAAIDREVLVLRHFEELTNTETAQVLNVSPTAATNRYARALNRLKEILVETSRGVEDLP